jgi:hypothetical protein
MASKYTPTGRPPGRPKKEVAVALAAARKKAEEGTSNAQKLAILREIKRRERLAEYKDDFEKFAIEQVKILPKDPTDGFIPFQFNSAQRIINDKIEEQRKKTGKVRAIILKARQMGISTYSTSRVYWKSYFNPFNKSVVMAHDSATSDALFNMSRNIIDYMSEEFRPVLKKSNAKEIHFEHNDSGYRLYTAGSPEAGRGTTPTIAHLSEVAFWTHDEKILAGLFQGISQAEGTEVILESTANGVGNSFHKLWLGAVAGENEYIPIFVPWFLMEEYRRTTPENFKPTEDEERLKKAYGLDDEQIYWRRLKISESGLAKFKQEYPASAEEAFIVSGSSVFDLEKVNALVPQPIISIREFDHISRMFEQKDQGSLEIYRHFTHEEPFVIGADTSLGVGRDYSTAVVMNANRQVAAVYRNNRIDPSKFGDLLFYLGRYFNNALLAVENNSMGIATLNRLVQMEYQNLYYQTKIANVSKEEGTRVGWRTTSASKPAIIGFLKNAIENGDIWIPSRTIIHELSTYITDDNGSMSAAPGYYDDTVIATAIALEVIRTHRDKLTTNRITFKQRIGETQPETVWL